MRAALDWMNQGLKIPAAINILFTIPGTTLTLPAIIPSYPALATSSALMPHNLTIKVSSMFDLEANCVLVLPGLSSVIETLVSVSSIESALEKSSRKALQAL